MFKVINCYNFQSGRGIEAIKKKKKKNCLFTEPGHIRYTTNFKFTSFNSILKCFHTHTQKKKIGMQQLP